MRILAAACLLALGLSAAADELDDRVVQTLKNSTRPASTEKADGLMREKKWVEAARAYVDHVARRPDDAGAWYNLACALSRAGRQGSAANALQGAFLAGYSDLEHVKADPDLAALRGSKGYEMALKAFRANKPMKVETVWVEAKALFHCYAARPAGYDEKKTYGLVLLLHGHGGSAENFLRSVPDWPGGEFVVAALESPYPAGASDGTQGYGWTPPAAGEDAQKGAALVVEQVAAAIDRLQEKFSIDAKRVYLVGSSEGAYLTARCAMAFPDRLAGFVFNSGGGAPGGALEKWKGKRILIAHGVNDGVISWRSAAEFARTLEQAGVQSELYWYDGEHALTPAMIEGIGIWLRAEAIPDNLRAPAPK
ncbi:MAG: dienelactone hydrolase family protein [Planctomycetes bacterium]|nr:dienelactone hydrolase family protein [Planctomycetota bacterium]